MFLVVFGIHLHEQLLNKVASTPLGQIVLAGRHTHGIGVDSRGAWRTYGSFAVMCVTRGTGLYRDSQGFSSRLEVGDLVFVFPHLAHWYGPVDGKGRPSGSWDEAYAAFSGPVFDLWLSSGLLSPACPVRRLGSDWKGWTSELLRCIEELGKPNLSASEIVLMHRFQGLLLDALTHAGREPLPDAEDWFDHAVARLSTALDVPLDGAELSASLGLGYESFRKQFKRRAGVSPMQYRLEQRIAVAKEMLSYSETLTNREIAESLGFSDEHHFSKTFKARVGVSPNRFKRL